MDTTVLPMREGSGDVEEWFHKAQLWAIKAKADSTTKQYVYAVARFGRWAETHKLEWLPAKVSSVMAYLAYLTEQKPSRSLICTVINQ